MISIESSAFCKPLKRFTGLGKVRNPELKHGENESFAEALKHIGHCTEKDFVAPCLTKSDQLASIGNKN